jgi:hypothetical protein
MLYNVLRKTTKSATQKAANFRPRAAHSVSLRFLGRFNIKQLFKFPRKE